MVDSMLLSESGLVDPAFGAGAAVSVEAIGGPVGAAELDAARLLVWTSGGTLITLATNGALLGTSDLDIGGTLLAATLDTEGRLLVVAMVTERPQWSLWLVRRYLL
jgi:hypothetical protein